MNPKMLGHNAEVTVDGVKIFLAGKYLYDVTTIWDVSLDDGLYLGELFIGQKGVWGFERPKHRSETGFVTYEDALHKLIQASGEA